MIAKALNAPNDRLFATGHGSPQRAVSSIVVGRRTGREVHVPVVIAHYDGRRYLVSMLRADANWVADVRASAGRATLRRKGNSPVHLADVPLHERAQITRRYLELAPGARPHIPVDRRPPVADFEAIAAANPVFRIEPATGLQSNDPDRTVDTG